MQTWVFPVSGYSGRKYWGIFNSEAAISQLCENYKINNNNNITRSQTALKSQCLKYTVLLKKRVLKCVECCTLDRSLGSTATRCSVSLVQSSVRTFFSRALITCNVKDNLNNTSSTRLVSQVEDGATRRPSWLHSVLPAPALLTPDGQKLTAPPPGRLVVPQ